MTTANSHYEAQKQTGSSGSMSETKPYTAPASSSGYGHSSYNKWGGKLPKGTLVRFHVDTNGVGEIVEWDSKTKVYGVRWGEDKAICKGYRDSTITALSAEESARIYFEKYQIELDENETAKSVISKEVGGLQDMIKLLETRLTEAKAASASFKREDVPAVASHAGGW